MGDETLGDASFNFNFSISRNSRLVSMLEIFKTVWYRAIADPSFAKGGNCRRRAIYPTRELAIFVIFFNIVPINTYFFLILLLLQ